MPIVHEITNLYRELYITRHQIPKAERYGIFQKIENTVLDCLEIALTAALTEKDKKSILLVRLKIKIEIIQKLVRLIRELEIISERKHILFSQKSITISKMTSGWLKYLNKEPI
ncbi:MAG: hypothetical protein C3F02_02935 [Parcubacteria group bacterium]|nr:MAG: hypothetical protein C3F02_02935 [Parcubacteria group bacterium]